MQSNPFVVKIGGAVLNGSAGIVQALDIVRALPRPLLVVVSAFADVTNRLERIAERAVSDEAEALRGVEELFGDHTTIARTVLDGPRFDEWSERVDARRRRLEEIVRGLGIVGELSPRTLDLVVSFGERLSSSLLCAALDVPLLSATEIIITDARHRFARPQVEQCRERVEAKLKPMLREHGVVVTEGYIAWGTHGEVTTMGRESSDYSATLLGELLEADSVTIFTGVAGVMTADPALVEDAATIPGLSYVTARRLAELGAKVIHPRTVTPVERGRIPLRIMNVAGTGTTIGERGDGGAFSLASLGRAGFIEVETENPSDSVEPFLLSLGTISPIVWHDRFRRTLRIVTATMPDRNALPIAQLGGRHRSISVRPAAVLSVVREGVIGKRDLTAVADVLEGEGVLAVRGGLRDGTLSAVIEPARLREVANALHARLMEEVGAEASGRERVLHPTGA